MIVKTNTIKKCAIALLWLIPAASFAQITVDASLTAQELVQDILINGTCAQTSNFISSTGTDFGEENGIAAFDGSGTDFPFAGGIVLTSGDVQAVPGPNGNVESSGGWPGDADLENFTNITPGNSNDASFIQFDFVPLTGQLSFDFIMASEEYNQNFECTFSDAFAFILTDLTTGTSENLAVLPGTTTPIQVTNIRSEVPGGLGCAAVNEEFFGQYNFLPFNDEDTAAINMNGQTVELTAMSDVIIGNPYTIKLVVADDQDNVFNMSVFIEAGSFNIGSTDLGENLLVSSGNAPCEGDEITLDGTDPDALSYSWFFNDILIPGETNPTLDISVAGTYSVEVVLLDLEDCLVRDDITVEFINGDAVNLGNDMTPCDGDVFTITSGIAFTNATFVWLMDGNEIAGETLATLDVTETGIYTLQATFNESCTFSDDILITFNESPMLDLGEDISSCLEDPLTLDATPTNVDPAAVTYQWFLNGFPIAGATNVTFDATVAGTYSVEITLGICVGTDTIIITQGNPDGTGCSANDLCFDSEVIECGDVVTGSTFGSTSNGAPTGVCGTTAGAPGNWYSFIGTGNIIQLGLCTSTFDTKLQVYTGTCDNLNCVDGNDDSCGLQSEVDFLSTPGTEYFIYVFGFGAAQGNYMLDINCVCISDVTVGADQEFCDEDSFEIVSSLSGETIFNPTYLWSNGETTPNITVTNSGTFSVEVTTAGGCTVTDSVDILLNDTPIIDLGADFLTCFDTPVVLDGSPTNVDPASATYQWFLNGELQIGVDTAQFEIFEIGTYEVEVNIGSCVQTSSVTVEPREDLVVTLDNPFITCPDTTNTLTASTNETGVTYRWFLNGDEIIGQTTSTLDFEIPALTVGEQIFTVEITLGDCTGETSTTVSLYAIGNCVIGQGISPDGSPGFNDFLDLTFLSDRSGIDNLEIYNRHGRLVFERANYVNEWAGQTDISGDILPTGTYFYVINFAEEDPEYGRQSTGWIYLNRSAE